MAQNIWSGVMKEDVNAVLSDKDIKALTTLNESGIISDQHLAGILAGAGRNDVLKAAGQAVEQQEQNAPGAGPSANVVSTQNPGVY